MALRYFAKLLAIGQHAELLQALVLDLPAPLPGDVERPSHLVERPRLLTVEPVAHLEDPLLPRRERAQDLLQRVAAKGLLGGLLGERSGLVGEEVAELRLLVVPHRLLEGDRQLRAAPDLLDLLSAQVELAPDLDGGRLTPELAAQLPLGAHDLVQLLDDVHGHADRPRLVRKRPGDCLADPPRRVRRELEPLAVVELLGGANEPDRALLDQIEERQPLVAVALGDGDDEAEVRFDHRLLREVVSPLDLLRELDLLRRGQQVDLADVLQKELERISRDVRPVEVERLFLGLLLLGGHDLDVQLLQYAVELVDLRRVERLLVERERDLLGRELSRLPAGLYEVPDLVDLEDAPRYPRSGRPLLPSAQLGSPSPVSPHGSRSCRNVNFSLGRGSLSSGIELRL